MLQILSKIVKWTSIPVLLFASMFSALAGDYEPVVSLLICMGAIILVQRAVRLREYVSGAGYVAIVVVFSPLFLVVKIFLLLVLASVAAVVTVLAAFRMRRVPVA